MVFTVFFSVRIAYIILTGLLVLGGVFIASLYYQNNVQNDIAKITEYHSEMSIPAISALDNIVIKFEKMHSDIHNIVLDNKRAFHIEEYFIHKNDALNQLDAYSSLIFVQNSDGKYHADEKMRNSMQDFVTKQRESLTIFDRHVQELIFHFEKGSSDPEIIETLLNSLDGEELNFRAIHYDALKMEMNGIHVQQSILGSLEIFSSNLFLIFTVIELVLIVAIVISLSYLLRNNIHQLTNITHEITSGNLNFKIKFKKKNEFTPLADNIAIMQESLKKSREELVKSERLSVIGELSSRLAHDLRNPLHVIKNSAEIIKIKSEDKFDDVSKQQFDYLQRAINRMSHQIDNVLDFIKMAPIKMKNSNLAEVIKSSLNELNIPDEIAVSVPKESVNVYCDPHLLDIVFKNLIWNSVQAIDKKGKIEIKFKEDNSNIVIEIQDTGMSISDDNLEKIFDPLFTTKQHGTGLGLSSCKKIVEAHNGRISVKNNPTRFFIQLPKGHVESIKNP
jgi:signal transduction histidine kinase